MVKVEVHHYFHNEPATDISSKLAQILRIVQALKSKEDTMAYDLTELKNTTAQTKGAVESVKVVMGSAVAKFNEILGKLQNTVDPTEIAAIVAEGKDYTAALTAARDDLAAAVEQFNPPPAPPPPEV